MSFFKSLFGASKKTEATTEQKKDAPKENPYLGLRQMALTMKAEQLGYNLPADRKMAYGIVMDMAMTAPVTTATLVAYVTGDASLYLSSGGGFIGAGQHAPVKAAAQQFIALGQFCEQFFGAVVDTNLPASGEVHFYLLTSQGTFFAKETMANLENNSSKLVRLFGIGNNLLTEIRVANGQ